MARLLALDVGEVRIGVAVCDATGFLASPYTTLHVSRNKDLIWQEIAHLIEETEAEGLVIGLPISLDGQIHAQGERVQAFAADLQTHISLPLTFWDERLSTVEAERLLAQRPQHSKNKRRSGQHQSSKRRHKGQEIDALAAAVFLQDYLDTHKIEDKERTI